MKYIKDIILIGAVVIATVFLMRNCGPGEHTPEPIEIITYDTTYVTDTVTKVDTILDIKYKYKVIRIEVPVYIDTNKAIKDYYTVKEIIDTLSLDSNITVVVTDTVYMNNIVSRIARWNAKLPSMIVTKHTETFVYKNGFELGGGMQFNYDGTKNIMLIGKYNLCRYSIGVAATSKGGSIFGTYRF